MALVKRSNSKFWYAQFQINHQTVIRSTRTTDRRVAEKIAEKIRAEAVQEILLGRKRSLTVEEALARFVDSKAGTANHRNLLGHQRTLLSHFKGVMPLTALSSSMLEQFYRRRLAAGCHPQTVKHGLNCLMGAIKQARKEGHQCPDLDLPSIKIPNRMVRYLSQEDERRLLIELDPQRLANGLPDLGRRSTDYGRWMQDNYDLVVILLDTGARYGEIANIRWDQIDLAVRAIRLWRSKVQNESILFMTDRVAAILERRSRSSTGPFVFTSKDGGSRGYSAMAIRKAMLRAGLDGCTIHTLRHTHATRLVQNGLSVYEVRAVLGHSDIKTTMRYAHLEQSTVTAKARDVIERFNGFHSFND